MKKLILITLMVIFPAKAMSGEYYFYDQPQTYNLEKKYLNEELKMDFCAFKVQKAMSLLWKNAAIKAGKSLNEQVMKEQKNLTDFEIARLYCKIVEKRKDKIKISKEKALALLISIGKSESNYNPNAKHLNSSGIQQVLSRNEYIDRKRNPKKHHRAEKWFEQKDIIRPTQEELINNVELNIDWSLYLLDYFRYNPEKYNGHPVYKKKYASDVNSGVNNILVILKGAL